ncbi:MAG: LuxR C-terminal-related transcriptional regulator [Geovibrio sp.]|nr:LuxR C-terminal-related transcriptional regulator [Geovibrio sp.]MCD8568342.1 LuxR C-terminal-related transcriptional regulator [Geovibrio sp.]
MTLRECEVLKLIAAGKTSREIAEELFISKNTVDTHRNKMLQKLNLSNSASLVTYACKSGLL